MALTIWLSLIGVVLWGTLSGSMLPIILNSCLATMANMLQRSLTMTIPEVVRGDGASLFEVWEGDEADGLVLFLYIDFAVRKRDIRGYIAMLMDLPNLKSLRSLLQEYIDRMSDKTAPADVRP